jgi:pimeloyl-ACP methyl ester carboxylesterase
VQAEPGRPFSKSAVEAVHARHPQLRVESLAAGHCLPIEAPAAFADLVREFVSEAVGEPGAAR